MTRDTGTDWLRATARLCTIDRALMGDIRIWRYGWDGGGGGVLGREAITYDYENKVILTYIRLSL